MMIDRPEADFSVQLGCREIKAHARETLYCEAHMNDDDPKKGNPGSNRKIAVGFTQQQWQLIDRLKDEGRWGDSRAEIVGNVFRDYVRQELGE
jgi:hypothetical protein